MEDITRREFIGKAAAGTAGTVLLPVFGKFTQTGKWPAGVSGIKFHLIGHAHIDPVWLWPWQEGIAVVLSSFRSALDRMNETPDFKFTASSAQFYEWVAENDPAMLSEIRKRVDEGRWNVVGGWWVEPDMNIPGGEAMVRQGLYGQRTLQKLLGRKATVAFNPDAFGHAGTVPQIVKLQGMKNYVFMRPSPSEKELPADMFWWEGPDGSRVLTYRIPISYNDSRSVRNRIQQILERFKNQAFKTYMSFYGVGDHGGGATRENIASIQEIQAEKGAPSLMFSTPDNFFEVIRADKNLSLPVVKNDLQHHAPGCYTAEAEIKKNNRLSETALVTAEKISAIGSLIWKSAYPKEEFTAAWKRVLFLQFHDSLAGTSVPEHSASAREGYGYALDVAHQAIYKTIQKLEWQIPTSDPDSQYMIAFNPHAWDIESNIEYDFSWDQKKDSTVEDEKGKLLMHQWTTGSTETGNRKGILVKTTIPALGYRQIRIKPEKTKDPIQGVSVSKNSLENEFLRLTVSGSGTIDLFDKENGIEVFKGNAAGCRAVVIDDPSDTWSHDIKSFSKEIGAFDNADIIILESGPLRGIIRAVSKYGDSTLAIDWILHAGARTVEARVSINWNEKLKMLKFSFPVNVESPAANYESPYGFITREANGDEDPGQRWIDVSGSGKGAVYGLAVINDAKYGYSVNGNDMRISVLRSAVFAHHNPRVLNMDREYIWQDQGIHNFRMMLVPHKGTWQENSITRRAEEFLSPPVALYQGIHGGSMPGAGSFIRIESNDIIISSIKQAEEGNDLIIRCVETSGKSVTATVDFSFINRKWTGSFKPCEIKSLRLDCHNGSVKEVNLLEEDIQDA